VYLQTVVSVSQHYKNPTKCVDLVQRGRYYHNQGRIQDFKLGGGTLKKIAPSGGRREHFWGISCEISLFYAKKTYFFQDCCLSPIE
jgi:hypothetical protein